MTQHDGIEISEIFFSLQGEANGVGWPSVFVRLSGCPLRCGYCDTRYAYSGGERMEVAQILKAVEEYGAGRVCVTGGEPLAQPAVHHLLGALCDEGYLVSLETGGSIDIGGIDPRVVRVVDLKTPGSGEQRHNHYQNIEQLRAVDQVKFVICDFNDFEWSREMVMRYDLPSRCDVLFSPSSGQVSPTQLADWILEYRLPIRFQLQLHKILWGEERGR